MSDQWYPLPESGLRSRNPEFQALDQDGMCTPGQLPALFRVLVVSMMRKEANASHLHEEQLFSGM